MQWFFFVFWFSVSDYQEDEGNNFGSENTANYKREGESALKYVMITRTRPKTCDRVVNLFMLNSKFQENGVRKSLCDR